jgi:hypothetical protein
MRITNFFALGPPWVSNTLSAVFSLLLLISQLGPEIAELFGIINCQTCLNWLTKTLAVTAVILSMLKLLLKAKIPVQINSSQKASTLPRFKHTPKPPPITY